MSKLPTPMNRLRSHIQELNNIVQDLFNFTILNRRKEKTERCFSYGRKAINFDTTYLYIKKNLMRDYSPLDHKGVNTFAISFNYILNPENPTIFFSTKREDQEQPVYSQPLLFDEAKSILKDVIQKLKREQHPNKGIKESAIMDTLDYCFFNHEFKESSSTRNENYLLLLTDTITNYLKTEDKANSLSKKISGNISKVLEKTKTGDTAEHIRKLQNEIRILNKKIDDLNVALEKERKDLFDSYMIYSDNKKLNHLNEELKNFRLKAIGLCHQAGLPVSTLEEKINNMRLNK